MMKLCIALDLPSAEENLALLESLKDEEQIWVKVGLRSFIRDGVGLLERIKAMNGQCKIFLDVKIYDI